MDKSKKIRAQGNSGRYTTEMSNRRYSKKRTNLYKRKKMISKPILVEEADVEELIETNQFFTNVKKLLEPHQYQLIKLS